MQKSKSLDLPPIRKNSMSKVEILPLPLGFENIHCGKCGRIIAMVYCPNCKKYYHIPINL